MSIHTEYRYYQEHVNNIHADPYHQAYHLNIKTDEMSREEVIWECYLKLVLKPEHRPQ